MSYGYWKKLLRINLTKSAISEEQIDDDIVTRFFGAKGIGAYYFCREVRTETEPFSAENKVIFSAGPFQGTEIPSVGKCAVITKSPLTNLFLDSYCGGEFGHELKHCGYDLLVIEGAAPSPVYITVRNSEAEIKGASALWGRDTLETEQIIKATEGKGRVACIGPAGEKKVRFSCLLSERRRAAGRGGIGAVFGAKKLKAIFLSGSKQVAVKDKEKLDALIKQVYENMKNDKERDESFYKYGTSRAVEFANSVDRLPTRNFEQCTFESVETLGHTALHTKYNVTRHACSKCGIACAGFIEELKKDRPEYETLAMLGSNCGIADVETVVEANEVCNRLGLDTISTGNVIAFVMECSKKGVIEHRYRFGSKEDLLKLISEIANRKGVGNALAEGTRYLAMRYPMAKGFAMNVKGLELPAWDARGVLGGGLAYMTADIGGSHLREQFTYKQKKQPKTTAVEIVEDLIHSQHRCVIRDCYIICTFALGIITAPIARELYFALTGNQISEAEENTIAERIWNLVRLYNTGANITRNDDRLPQRLYEDPLPTGVAKGCTAFISAEDEKIALERYYELRGWDKNGIPKKETLAKLNLSDFIS